MPLFLFFPHGRQKYLTEVLMYYLENPRMMNIFFSFCFNYCIDVVPVTTCSSDNGFDQIQALAQTIDMAANNTNSPVTAKDMSNASDDASPGQAIFYGG